MAMFRLPPTLDLKDQSDLGEQLKKWKRELEVYFDSAREHHAAQMKTTRRKWISGKKS